MSDQGLPAPAESLGARMRAAREAAGLSQVAIARRLGELLGKPVEQTLYSRWERDVNTPGDETVRAIAHATRVSPGWLTHGDVAGCAAPTWWKGGGGASGTGSLPGTKGPTPKRRHGESPRRRKTG